MTEPGREGTTLGSYQLLERLGGGVFGEVYRAEVSNGASASVNFATASAPRTAIAMKVLRPPASDQLTQQAVAQIERIAELRHRHIIPFAGAVTEGSTVGIAMAYARGGSLADVLVRSGAITLPLAAGVIARLSAQLGHALQATHTVGIVHGDLKPSNIFVRTSSRGAPVAILSDFGQSGLTPLAAQLAMRGGASDDWIGKQLQFAAPEQLHGELSPATDQYGLAAVLYYLLTGRPPFIGSSETLAAQVLTSEPTPVSALNPDASSNLDEVMARALTKRPEQRFASVELFVRALNAALADVTTNAVTGVTREFARLGGARAKSGSAPPMRMSADELPDDTPATLWRPLAAATIAALLIALVTCAVSVYAIHNASGTTQTKAATFEGPNAAPTVAGGIDPSQTTEGQQAQARLQTILSTQPLFKDTLTSNTAKWQVAPGQVYFGDDHRLHLNNTIISHPIATDAPTPAPTGDYAEQVTMSITSGVGGDLAGIRFFVSGPPDAQTYYAFFLSPDGQYYLWYYKNTWSFISGGFAPHMNRGDGASNTITVITHSSAHQASLFVNGAYVGVAPLNPDGPTRGGAGVIVLNHGVEATYTNFALYTA